MATGDKKKAVMQFDIDTASLSNDATRVPSSPLVKSALNFVPDTGNAGFHNCIYRGKALGSSVTAAQQAAIAAGTFDDMYIGDYWTINNKDWCIAHFDYWRSANTLSNRGVHHVVIVPKYYLARAKINSTATTAGGYMGSDYYTGNNGNTSRADAQALIDAAFGSSHLFSHQKYLSSHVTDGIVDEVTSVTDSAAELMTETMLFGSSFFSSAPGLEAGSDWQQLAIARLWPDFMSHGSSTWLRNVATDTKFCVYSYNSRPNALNANASGSNDYFICPVFAIQYS